MKEPYTTIEAVFEYLGIEAPSESSSLAEEIQSWIIAMSIVIDNMTKRVIYNGNGESAAETYLYDGDGTDLLMIKDCIDITDVSIDGSSLEADEWVEYPSNKPYTSRLGLKIGKFPCGRQNVAVTAIQAMTDELPDDVKLACTILVAGVYNARYSTGKAGTSEKIGNYSVSYNTQDQIADFDSVNKILSSYKRIAI